jgi:hypothetical protein
MTATAVSSAEIAHALVSDALKRPSPEPPPVLENGTLVTLRMGAHSRSPNQEPYFAPAVVLAQYEPHGEIDALVWDASAGNHFVHGYTIRDIGTRDTQAGREQYVIQSNIGQVLFSPSEFATMQDMVTMLMRRAREYGAAIHELRMLGERLNALEAMVTAPAPAPALASPAVAAEAPTAAPLEAKSDPKGQTKRA